jgi:hypothetical protein
MHTHFVGTPGPLGTGVLCSYSLSLVCSSRVVLVVNDPTRAMDGGRDRSPRRIGANRTNDNVDVMQKQHNGATMDRVGYCWADHDLPQQVIRRTRALQDLMIIQVIE